MVSAVSSINQYIPNPEALEVIRRLQSLGVTPTGNLNIDRQRLQTAELQKRQITLASNSEQNLNKLEGTGKDFSSMLDNINKQLPAVICNTNKTSFNSIQTNEVFNNKNVVPFSDAKETIKDSQDRMIGATQLGELNKIRLGLIA
ncbi:hypothetical protein J6O48_12300 [bacterium]|nr:hypothetical protein [bacterium]